MALHLEQNKGWLLRHVHNNQSTPQSPWVQVVRVLRDPPSSAAAAVASNSTTAPEPQCGWLEVSDGRFLVRALVLPEAMSHLQEEEACSLHAIAGSIIALESFQVRSNATFDTAGLVLSRFALVGGAGQTPFKLDELRDFNQTPAVRSLLDSCALRQNDSALHSLPLVPLAQQTPGDAMRALAEVMFRDEATLRRGHPGVDSRLLNWNIARIPPATLDELRRVPGFEQPAPPPTGATLGALFGSAGDYGATPFVPQSTVARASETPSAENNATLFEFGGGEVGVADVYDADTDEENATTATSNKETGPSADRSLPASAAAPLELEDDRDRETADEAAFISDAVADNDDDSDIAEEVVDVNLKLSDFVGSQNAANGEDSSECPPTPPRGDAAVHKNGKKQSSPRPSQPQQQRTKGHLKTPPRATQVAASLSPISTEQDAFELFIEQDVNRRRISVDNEQLAVEKAPSVTADAVPSQPLFGTGGAAGARAEPSAKANDNFEFIAPPPKQPGRPSLLNVSPPNAFEEHTASSTTTTLSPALRRHVVPIESSGLLLPSTDPSSSERPALSQTSSSTSTRHSQTPQQSGTVATSLSSGANGPNDNVDEGEDGSEESETSSKPPSQQPLSQTPTREVLRSYWSRFDKRKGMTPLRPVRPLHSIVVKPFESSTEAVDEEEDEDDEDDEADEDGSKSAVVVVGHRSNHTSPKSQSVSQASSVFKSPQTIAVLRSARSAPQRASTPLVHKALPVVDSLPSPEATIVPEPALQPPTVLPNEVASNNPSLDVAPGNAALEQYEQDETHPIGLVRARALGFTAFVAKDKYVAKRRSELGLAAVGVRVLAKPIDGHLYWPAILDNESGQIGLVPCSVLTHIVVESTPQNDWYDVHEGGNDDIEGDDNDVFVVPNVSQKDKKKRRRRYRKPLVQVAPVDLVTSDDNNDAADNHDSNGDVNDVDNGENDEPENSDEVNVIKKAPAPITDITEDSDKPKKVTKRKRASLPLSSPLSANVAESNMRPRTAGQKTLVHFWGDVKSDSDGEDIEVVLSEESVVSEDSVEVSEATPAREKVSQSNIATQFDWGVGDENGADDSERLSPPNIGDGEDGDGDDEDADDDDEEDDDAEERSLSSSSDNSLEGLTTTHATQFSESEMKQSSQSQTPWIDRAKPRAGGIDYVAGIDRAKPVELLKVDSEDDAVTRVFGNKPRQFQKRKPLQKEGVVNRRGL